MSKRKSRAPLHTEDLDDYTPQRARVAPARQLCTASNREVTTRPRDDRCPTCNKRLTIQVVRGRRVVRDFSFAAGGNAEVADARVLDEVYVIPSHLPRREP